ncbi:probable polygalacturonase At3g15720 [Olea europaea subsp. europaea]|uniref:Probable polygalacturonase At3g15720 n=1 Tax=Olea europaea subsp. europaea TaxID=158383 RepID=A0A8S0V1K1_OLEEU|nr:probable polygalacturonase At3g15720 [Olea europaea subsp. europaea]
MCNARPPTFDVTKFGAFGDGQEDDTKVFETAWQAACQNGKNGAKITVPQGKIYLVNHVEFVGAM